VADFGGGQARVLKGRRGTGGALVFPKVKRGKTRERKRDHGHGTSQKTALSSGGKIDKLGR